jgi:hypothetical protein
VDAIRSSCRQVSSENSSPTAMRSSCAVDAMHLARRALASATVVARFSPLVPDAGDESFPAHAVFFFLCHPPQDNRNAISVRPRAHPCGRALCNHAVQVGLLSTISAARPFRDRACSLDG